MFKQIESKKVYNQIIEQIKDGILNGTFQKGMKLPSERAMSEQLHVSRASVREAIRSLEIMGLVQCKQGEGNYISSDVESSLVEQLKLMFMLNNGKFREINELRIALEMEAVKLQSVRTARTVRPIVVLAVATERARLTSLKIAQRAPLIAAAPRVIFGVLR